MFRDPFQPGLADVSFVAFDDVDALDAELAAGEPEPSSWSRSRPRGA